MSKRLVNFVWERFPGRGADLNVFQAIAEAANENGNCIITMQQLAGAARVSVASVIGATARLRKQHWLVSDRIAGHGRPNVYQINIPKLKRAIRPDHDPNSPQNDAIRAARKAEKLATRKSTHLAAA